MGRVNNIVAAGIIKVVAAEAAYIPEFIKHPISDYHPIEYNQNLYVPNDGAIPISKQSHPHNEPYGQQYRQRVEAFATTGGSTHFTVDGIIVEPKA